MFLLKLIVIRRDYMSVKENTKSKNLIGSKIKYFRKEAGLSQKVLRIMLRQRGVNIGKNSISRIENGTRLVTDYELLVLSEILGVTPITLLMDEQ